MTYWLKQPWVQALIALAAIALLVTGVYWIGKRAGRAAASTAFDARQADLLRKSQDALAKADAAAAKAEESEAYAARLKETIALDRKAATEAEAQATGIYQRSIGDIDEKYAKESAAIRGDMPACQRCRDLCDRANGLADYGPEFAGYRCDAAADCADACDP